MRIRTYPLTRRSPRLLALQIACATALVAGCGGGGDAASVDMSGTGGSQSQIQSVPLQTYITDNLATDYSKVWVSIEKITAVDSTGAEVMLLDATAAPAVVNLASLAAVGQFMSTAGIPAGVYTEVRVTLVNSVQLVSLDGSSTITAKLAASGPDVVIHVRNLSLDPATSGQLVLDFNLAKFTYDPSTGLVTPVVEAPPPSDAFGKFVRQQAEVNGLVQAVDTVAGSLTVNDAHLGSGIVVTLGADAVIVDEATGANVALASLAAGEHVEIKGVVTPGATTADPVTVVASVVHVEVEHPPAAAPAVVSAAGTVSSISGSLVTIAVNEASFLPGAGSVVVDIGAASFSHGQASDLAPGIGIDFRGTLNAAGSAAQVAATQVDVQGAPSQGDRQKNPTQTFNAVNGAVVTVNPDGTFTVAQTHGDGPVATGTYTVDATGAVYLEGTASCLASGQVVQVIGSLSGMSMAAKIVKVKGCTVETHSEPPPLPPAPSASGPH